MNSLEHMQQVFAKIRKPAAAAQQIHATYVTELLARTQSGDQQDAFERMLADLEPELDRQALQLAKRQPEQGRPLAGRHAHEDAGKTRQVWTAASQRAGSR